ncbi:hypothetical protein GTA08_BOTSDO00512 [Botryosphaeria dothidea]|uniref:Cyclin N-terminal domain-containing protein n=1 Tax=Botryosphaeria dothidea TaxID=55169 RepID=A0A8H4JAD0_9PEZI|nr:hypothetical protein GTA08_BOTSDO00512 [Botryosphaeria dothidea]
MHRKEPDAAPLTFPSPTYDALRSGLVRTELILLRVLKFELRIPTPFDFLPGYISQVMRDFDIGDTSTDAAHGFDRRSKEKKEAAKITDIMDTGIAKACKTKALFACKSYQLANYFPAKTIAAGCVYIVLKNRGLLLEVHAGTWLKEKIGRSIEMEDFEEAISILGQD